MSRHPEYSTVHRIREKLDAARRNVERADGFGGSYVILKGTKEDPEPFVLSRQSSLWTQDFREALAVHPAFNAGFLGGHVVELEVGREVILGSLKDGAKVLQGLLSPYWRP